MSDTATGNTSKLRLVAAIAVAGLPGRHAISTTISAATVHSHCSWVSAAACPVAAQ